MSFSIKNFHRTLPTDVGLPSGACGVSQEEDIKELAEEVFEGIFAGEAMDVDEEYVERLRIPDGSVQRPTYSFKGETDTGPYVVSQDCLGFSMCGQTTLNLPTNLGPYF